MNYELAKQLKDAGFPHHWCSEDDCSCLVNGDSTKGTACFPTLEELIEACGKRFSILHMRHRGASAAWGNHKWHAAAEPTSEDSNHVFADSPTEAVALLWLALNEKV